MKAVHSFSVVLLSASLLFLSIACTPTSGEPGPQGPAGPQGVAGPQGPAGQNGNANVTQVTFNQTFNATEYKSFTFPSAITTDILNSSAILVYIRTSNDPNNLYPIPGMIAGDDFRYILYPSSRSFQIRRQSGTYVSSVSMTKVIIIPANNLINGRIGLPDIDFSDYNAVKKYYNLPD